VSLKEALRVAFQALLANRLRSILTTLGVVIGVFSVVLLVAIGEGARKEITGTIEGLGSNLLFVLPGDGGFAGPPARSRFEVADVDRIQRELGGSGARITGAIAGNEVVAFEGERFAGQVFGVEDSYLDILAQDVERGQGITESDVATARRVTVLGAAAAEELFGQREPLGATVTIGSARFRVIGVLERTGGTAFGPPPDREVLIPLSTSQRLFGITTIDTIFIRSASTEALAADREGVVRALSRRFDTDEYTILSQDDIAGAVGSILQVLTFVLAAIAAISLLVGGVGVSNIMLVSVSERTREIGLRKALGARTRDVTLQFLFEAVALTGLGGLIGLGAGVGLATLIAAVAPVPAEVTGWSVALALGVSVVVGLVFGVLPARRAGRLDPVEALRRD
jgi:putative ABC transport system permease protein